MLTVAGSDIGEDAVRCTCATHPGQDNHAMPALADRARRAVKKPLHEVGLRLQSYVYRRPPPWSAWRAGGLPATEPFEEAREWAKLDTRPLSLRPVDVAQTAEVPALAHGLQQVLRGRGLFPLHAPWDRRGGGCAMRSRDAAYLRTIIPPEHIAWDRMPRYVPAKDDVNSHELAASLPGVQYTSSTSSMTPTLATLYHLISNFRDTELFGGLSARMSELPVGFTRIQRRPCAFMLTPVAGCDDDVFAITAHDAQAHGPSILLELGNSIERMLTMPASEFQDNFVRRGEAPPRTTFGPSGEGEQFYHYSHASQFLLRAQIDARNPDNGEVFDVKTRAVAAIRYNLANYKEFSGTQLRTLRGVSDSYEREFYDMVRSVFIKYALQLRIGRMSGALIAYHNTAEMLGLEYVTLSEIEAYVFGGSAWADVAFGTTLRLLEEILARVREALFAAGEIQPVKVLLATERSRRRITVYAMRMRPGETDALGPEAFARVATEMDTERASVRDPLQSSDFWHADAALHRTEMPGVAMVGAIPEVARYGGEKVSHSAPGNLPRKRGVANNPVHDVRNYDTAGLVPREFYVWHVDVAPLVKGKLAPKGGIDVAKARDFELRYTINQVKNITDYVKAEYVTDLGRLYAP